MPPPRNSCNSYLPIRAGSSIGTEVHLSNHARITSHWLRGLCGAGTRAGRVPTHRDACRACSKTRPEESGRGRVRVRVRVCATSVAEKLFLRGLLAAGSPPRGLQPVRVMYHADWPHRTHFPPSLAAVPSVICPCSSCCSPAVGAPP